VPTLSPRAHARAGVICLSGPVGVGKAARGPDARQSSLRLLFASPLSWLLLALLHAVTGWRDRSCFAFVPRLGSSGVLLAGAHARLPARTMM
jgi:hypothetical protein